MKGRKSTGRGRRGAWAGKGRPRGIAAVALIGAAALLLGLAATSLASPGDAPRALRLSEVVTSGAASALKSDWIELENASDAPVELSGYAVYSLSRPSKLLALPSERMEPGERLVILCDGSDRARVDGELHAPFKLSAAGETVVLLGRDGAQADRVDVPSLGRGQAYCLGDAGEWAVTDFATPGGANRVELDAGGAAGEADVVPGTLEITEVMSRNETFFPDENGRFPDYVELHNATDAPVNLDGWKLSDDASRPDKWAFPAVTLPAGGYLAVHCSGASAKDDPNHLHANFKLDRNGEELLLTDPDGTPTFRVRVPALPADEAYSLTEAGWVTALPPTPGHPNDEAETEPDILRANERGVYISEVLTASDGSADWIELYNAGPVAADLSGCGLSDNAAHPRKWRFPSGTVLGPGEYLCVSADGVADAPDGVLHAGFALSSKGGYSVTLSDPDGNIFDRLFVPAQQRDVSYGRASGLTEVGYFDAPTPGAANAGTLYRGRAPQPVYSERGGLFKTGDVVTVALSAPGDCRIYYTTDCTDPTPSSLLYTGPITITGTTILRARAYRDGCLPSQMDAHSYLFDVKNGGGTVYVASMVSDPYNLTSEEAGILVKGPNATSEYPYGERGKGANFWMDWEREAHVELFRPDGSSLLSQECGIMLHGTHSRSADQKPFKVIARSKYGSNRFSASIFSRRDYDEYQSFVLRTGSQDAKRTRMRDAVLQQLAVGAGLMYQEYEIGVLYLNGQYWGQYNLRERVNAESICQWEGWEGDEDALDLIRGNDTVMQGSDATMQALIEWLKTHDLNSDEAYEAVDAAVDIDNFIAYMAIEMYTGNTDTLNMKRYRNPGRDGKWRWVLFDLDCGFDIDTDSVSRWLDPEGMGRGKNTDNRLFVACMRNARFREKFLMYLGERMATTFTADYVVGLIESFYHGVKSITPDHLARWGLDESDYREEMEYLVSYARTRPERMLYFLKTAENLRLTREEMERFFGDALALAGLTYDTIPSKSALMERP